MYIYIYIYIYNLYIYIYTNIYFQIRPVLLYLGNKTQKIRSSHCQNNDSLQVYYSLRLKKHIYFTRFSIHPSLTMVYSCMVMMVLMMMLIMMMLLITKSAFVYQPSHILPRLLVKVLLKLYLNVIYCIKRDFI